MRHCVSSRSQRQNMSPVCTADDQIHFLAPAPSTHKPIVPPENGRLGAAGPFFEDKYKRP